ncbi:uncharacterized protein LOC110910486 [Helianthus annuus]|uniref:uncharacterized protein LOC110910486 n=1 Tax=Helianthus annuus TaxID=4232 RepID=UPI001652FB1E|nr:uncharacterized protein LOC110910486 [Helianthus annuus]
MAGKPFTHSPPNRSTGTPPKSIHEPSPKSHGAARLLQPGDSRRSPPRPAAFGVNLPPQSLARRTSSAAPGMLQLVLARMRLCVWTLAPGVSPSSRYQHAAPDRVTDICNRNKL